MTLVTAAQNSEAFQRLVRLRRNVTRWLSGFMLLLLAGNLYLMCYGAGVAALKIKASGVISVGIIYSVCVILFGAAVSIFYVFWANATLDSLSARAKEEIKNESQGTENE